MSDKEFMWALKNGDLDEVKDYVAKVGGGGAGGGGWEGGRDVRAAPGMGPGRLEPRPGRVRAELRGRGLSSVRSPGPPPPPRGLSVPRLPPSLLPPLPLAYAGGVIPCHYGNLKG